MKIDFLRNLRSIKNKINATPISQIGNGNRIFTIGSGIGSDYSMIASNDRYAHTFNIRRFNSAISTKKQFLNTLTSSTFPYRKDSVSKNLSTSSGMDDEYGEMTNDGHTYIYPTAFKLESGEELSNARLRYMTYGKLNEARDNVLVVCHALTGNASLHVWWGDLLGPGQVFDTEKYFIVCCNVLGSCYGSTGPTTSVQEGCKELHGVNFPDVSIRDTVDIQLRMLKEELNVRSIKCVIGGSFGGMQALEYAVQAGKVDSPFSIDDTSKRVEPFVRSVIPIACGASHTAWQIAISEVQRQAIHADPKWNNGNPDMNDQPIKGFSIARQIGMISYRTAKGYESKFGRRLCDENMKPPYGSAVKWQVQSYLEYQGQKILSRFDPVTYLKLLEQLDTHDIGRDRGGKEMALSDVKIPALVLGIDSDILYPIHEQEELANFFPNGNLKVIKSEAGHDGFLLEQNQVAAYITEFLGTYK